MMLHRPVIAAAALALVACTEGPPQPAPTPTGRRTPPSVTLIAENVLLLPGPEGALRVGFQPFDRSARIIVRDAPTSATGMSTEAPAVALCPLTGPDAPLPPIATCTSANPGVRESVVGSPSLGAVAIVSGGTTPAAVTIFLEFVEGGRAVSAHMPLIRRGAGASVCKDNACNPFFELIPVRGGRFTAGARWSGGEARLVLLSGRVRARSFSATGLPYAEPAAAEGASPLSLRSRLSAPAEYALALAATGGEDLTDVVVESRWPG